jgi:hypothetical protein
MACARPLPAPGPVIFSFQRPKRGAHKQTQLGFAELAAEIVEARGDSSQPGHAFQNGFVPQRLKFFTQFVGDLPKACLQDFQGRRAQGFHPTLDPTLAPALDPALDPASSFNVGDVFHTSCCFELRVFNVKLAFEFARQNHMGLWDSTDKCGNLKPES